MNDMDIETRMEAIRADVQRELEPQRRASRIGMAIMDAMLICIALAVTWLGAVATIPPEGAMIVCLALGLTSYCNHKSLV